MDQMQSTTDVTPVITAPPLEPPKRQGIAPALHTLVLVALLFLLEAVVGRVETRLLRWRT